MVKKNAVPIPFPLSTFPGRIPQHGAGRLINCFAEAQPEDAGRKAVWRRAPGLKSWGTSSNLTYRGAILVGSTLYVAKADKIERYASAGGAATLVGALSGTDRVFFASNNKTPTPDQVVVCAAGAFTFDTSSVTSYADPDLPAPNAVCSIDGYFVFTLGDGRAFASDLNSTSINALSFGKAEAKPDGLTRPVPYGRLLLLFGPQTTEIWQNIGATPFPFQRALVIPLGLAGPHCVAGHEDGFGHPPLFVANDNTVRMFTGQEPQKVSPPILDSYIAAVSDKTTLQASVYVSGGHSFWQLSCADWTWVFNLTNSQWHERQSYGQARSRMTGGVNVSGKWLCGDTESGNILEIDIATKKEVTDPLIYRLESAPVKDFPHRLQVARADFDVATGVGVATGSDPIETDPTANVSWSDDDGVTWSVPLMRSLGRQSKPLTRVTVTRTGLTGTAGRRWRLEVADPVEVLVFGGTQSAESRYN